MPVIFLHDLEFPSCYQDVWHFSPPRPPDAHRLISSMDAKNRREQKDRVLRVPRKTQKRREQRGLCEEAKNDGYVWRALPGRGSRLAHPAGAHGQLPNAEHDRCAKWVLFWFFFLATLFPARFISRSPPNKFCLFRNLPRP